MSDARGSFDFAELARAIAASTKVIEKTAPSGKTRPFEQAVPADLAALYAVCDGLTLVDGTRIVSAAEIARTTAWLTEDRSLSWDDEILVLGERADMVVVRDLDSAGARGGGGVLEASHDDLESFRRVALTVLGYLAARVGIADPDPAPEILLRAAAARGDAEAIESALERPLYPGGERDVAHAALTLGQIRAKANDPLAAITAFERSVAARVCSVGRAARAGETKAAWIACAVAARSVGRAAIAEECERRAVAS